MDTNNLEMLLAAILAGATSLIVFICTLNGVLGRLKISSPAITPLRVRDAGPAAGKCRTKNRAFSDKG